MHLEMYVIVNRWFPLNSINFISITIVQSKETELQPFQNNSIGWNLGSNFNVGSNFGNTYIQYRVF